jgi:hypothetical protein
LIFAPAIRNETPTGVVREMLDKQAAACMNTALKSYPTPR